MSQARKCSSCGAPPTESDQKFCGFCGAELPPLPAAAPVIVQGGRWGDLEQRFQALEAHPERESLGRHTPSATGHGLGMAAQAVFGIVFTAIAGFMTLFFAALMGPLAIVPLLMAVLGVVITVSSLTKGAKLSSAPLKREPALVVDERVKVSGGSGNSSASTRYFITLQDRNGRRTEYAANDKIASSVTEGDMGFAYLKADFMLDFKRVEV